MRVLLDSLCSVDGSWNTALGTHTTSCSKNKERGTYMLQTDKNGIKSSKKIQVGYYVLNMGK